MVSKATGEKFIETLPDGSTITKPFINVTDLYQEAEIPFEINDVTGWATPDLLIITTTTEQNDEGPSHWLDVPRQRFIRLSTKF